MRQLLALILIAVLVVVAVMFLMDTRGFRWDGNGAAGADQPIGTAGEPVERSRAREVGAEIADGVATGLSAAERALANAQITAKIKSKMALDDTIRARTIDVDTQEGVVTLTGTVANEAERERAMRLAEETDGVSSVVDRLSVR
jgi:hypothetical protein